MAVFQTIFSFSLHFVGSPVASECPEPLGPRNCVQLSAATAVAANSADPRKAQPRRIAFLRMRRGGLGPITGDAGGGTTLWSQYTVFTAQRGAGTSQRP